MQKKDHFFSPWVTDLNVYRGCKITLKKQVNHCSSSVHLNRTDFTNRQVAYYILLNVLTAALKEVRKLDSKNTEETLNLYIL